MVPLLSLFFFYSSCGLLGRLDFFCVNSLLYFLSTAQRKIPYTQMHIGCYERFVEIHSSCN